jgi:NAD(P)-dependent dehydrogenase (short-subunit alcohol dehydrogenase family)
MSQPKFDLTGRLCLITGATSGLGRQFALCLSGAGAEVVITGRREARLAEVKAEIEAAGGKAHTLCFDVNDRAAVTASVEKIESDIGPIWCLVNNSGLTIVNRPEAVGEEDYDTILNTNLKAPFHLSQEVGRHMISRGAGGRMINISSMGATTSLKGNITYCMSKAGLSSMTQGLALEWARHGIRVNAILPGFIRTEMNTDYYDTEAGHAEIKGWPTRRLGEDSDLNGLILLLASDESDFMTGALIEADDGQPLGM